MIRTYQDSDAAPVVELWHRCGLTRPWNDPIADIERKVAMADDLFLIAEAEGSVVGTAMAGYDGHRGWVNYLAVDPHHRGTGLGRALMEEAEARLSRRGCPKLNLQVRTDTPDAIRFYQHLGFTTDEVVSLGKRLDS